MKTSEYREIQDDEILVLKEVCGEDFEEIPATWGTEPPAFKININPPETGVYAEVFTSVVLIVRGAPLLGIFEYPSLKTQIERYKSASWENVVGWNMNTVAKYFFKGPELKRINALEMLDEIEELVLIQAHYVIIIASNNKIDSYF